MQIQYDCESNPCSWKEKRESIPDQVINANTTLDIASQITDPPLSCLPSVFGYKPEDSAKLFKDKEFRLCNTTDESSVDFDINLNLLTLTAPAVS